MNRTIEEIKNYFEANPELRDSMERGITKTCSWGGTLDGVIDQMRGNFPQEYRSEEKHRLVEEIITLEVVDNVIVQAKQRFNYEVTPKQRAAIETWNKKHKAISA